MLHRFTYLEKDVALGNSGEKTVNINVRDPITALWLEMRCANGTTRNQYYPLHRCVTDIEVIDGSDVLYSLDGYQAWAVACADLGFAPLQEHHDEPVGPVGESVGAFGEEPHGPSGGVDGVAGAFGIDKEVGVVHVGFGRQVGVLEGDVASVRRVADDEGGGIVGVAEGLGRQAAENVGADVSGLALRLGRAAGGEQSDEDEGENQGR